MIFNTVQNAKKLHPAGLKKYCNIAVHNKITKILPGKLTNTANQNPKAPSSLI